MFQAAGFSIQLYNLNPALESINNKQRSENGIIMVSFTKGTITYASNCDPAMARNVNRTYFLNVMI